MGKRDLKSGDSLMTASTVVAAEMNLPKFRTTTVLLLNDLT